MITCVGAVTQRVVKVAASMRVEQIVASRRQVASSGRGYTGWTAGQLVQLVKQISGGYTQVVRDHGGPYQNGDDNDDWEHALDLDVLAGFDSLHLDVSKLPRSQQVDELVHLVRRYGKQVRFEIGGERDDQDWLVDLIEAVCTTGMRPEYAVVDVGGHIWADRQCGTFVSPVHAAELTYRYHALGIKTKAHNMDWAGQRSRFQDHVDAMNIAPEYGGVEADAWLHVMSRSDADRVLELAYKSGAWQRWFNTDEGTEHDRARCALRYCMMDEEVRDTVARYRKDEEFVRRRIRDAIARS